MSNFLEFDTHQKGYEAFNKTKSNIKNHLGRRFCYVLSKDYDKYRGTYAVRYSNFDSIRYNNITIDDGNDAIDFRDILELGIKMKKDQ